MALVVSSLIRSSVFSASKAGRHSHNTCREWYRAHGTALDSAPNSMKSRSGQPEAKDVPSGKEGGSGTGVPLCAGSGDPAARTAVILHPVPRVPLAGTRGWGRDRS
jgi:hypothetical protein